MTATHTPPLGGPVWNAFTPATTMTAREYVDAIAVLLQGVLDSNGGRGPEILIDQLRATLSLGGEYSTMPTPSSRSRPARELTGQASRISGQLASWAEAALTRLIASPEPLPNGPLRVRSHCYGEALVPEAAHLLLGPAGGPVPMMLYNEWIHQMVLLRDALLPFDNWPDVPLPVDEHGLRRLEDARAQFLSELLVRQVRHTSVAGYARRVLVPGDENSEAGYGFAYAGGSVLPVAASSPTILTATDLLTWTPGGAASEGPSVAYTARETDYYASGRTSARRLAPGTGTTLARATATVVCEPGPHGTRHVSIEVRSEGQTARIDLGQALRGHRYSYRAGEAGAPLRASAWLRTATRLSPLEVLRAPGLVWDTAGEYVIEPGQDGLVALAVLGAIYPENVVLRRSSDQADPASAGKPGPARFAVTLPDED